MISIAYNISCIILCMNLQISVNVMFGWIRKLSWSLKYLWRSATCLLSVLPVDAMAKVSATLESLHDWSQWLLSFCHSCSTLMGSTIKSYRAVAEASCLLLPSLNPEFDVSRKKKTRAWRAAEETAESPIPQSPLCRHLHERPNNSPAFKDFSCCCEPVGSYEINCAERSCRLCA